MFGLKNKKIITAILVLGIAVIIWAAFATLKILYPNLLIINTTLPSIEHLPQGAPSTQYKTVPVTLAGTEFKAQISDTDELKELGLSGRVSLEPNTGMLFVFSNKGRFGIWMKDMKFSIDILWIDENGKIIKIEKNATPESYPKVFISDTNASYVLEILAGSAESLKLQVGDTVVFDKNSICTRDSSGQCVSTEI